MGSPRWLVAANGLSDARRPSRPGTQEPGCLRRTRKPVSPPAAADCEDDGHGEQWYQGKRDPPPVSPDPVDDNMQFGREVSPNDQVKADDQSVAEDHADDEPEKLHPRQRARNHHDFGGMDATDHQKGRPGPCRSKPVNDSELSLRKISRGQPRRVLCQQDEHRNVDQNPTEHSDTRDREQPNAIRVSHRSQQHVTSRPKRHQAERDPRHTVRNQHNRSHPDQDHEPEAWLQPTSHLQFGHLQLQDDVRPPLLELGVATIFVTCAQRGGSVLTKKSEASAEETTGGVGPASTDRPERATTSIRPLWRDHF